MGKTKFWVPALLCMTLLLGCGTPDGETATTMEATVPEASEDKVNHARVEEFGLCFQQDGGLNPYSSTRLTNRPVMSLLYQGLFADTSEYRAEPVLCKTFSCSDDLKTYVFTLENATFSDGSQLDAEDVVASLKRSKNSPIYGNRFYQVKSIAATGNLEVTIELDAPYENLPVLLDIPIVRAEDVESSQPLGTGPYFLVDGESKSLARREDWWSEYPPVVEYDTIPLADAANAAQIRDEFEFGRTDLVCTDPGHESYIEYRCDYELWDSATGIMVYLACNTGGSSAFAGTTLRSSLTYGLDRTALAAPYRGFAQAASLPTSPKADCYDQVLAQAYGADEGAFKEAVANSGIGQTEVKLLVNGDVPSRVQVAELVAAQLQEGGLNVIVKALPYDDFREALRVGNYDFYLGEVRLSPNFDLSTFFREDGNLNYGGMASESLLEMNRLALENSGNYYDLYQSIMDDGRLCPVMFRTYAVYATRGIVTDLMPGLDNVFHNTNSRQLSDAKVQWLGSGEPAETAPPTEQTEP